MLQKLSHSRDADEELGIRELVGKELRVLDHGFVRVVDYMGSDAAVVQAARVSYGRGTKRLSEDRGLIRYLMRHRHTTPFEMCEIKLHVKLPIFVARQWIRHRTANVNEYSARYSVLDKEFYVPDHAYIAAYMQEAREESQLKTASAKGQADLFGSEKRSPKALKAAGRQSRSNKQGRDDVVGEAEAITHLKTITNISSRSYAAYERLLNETPAGKKIKKEFTGLARELARIVLPTNFYTQWYWKIDLHNLLHFVSLRADPHAQHEIREYARVIGDIVKTWVPLTWEAFLDYRQNGTFLSRLELELVKRLISGEEVQSSESGLSNREWKEFANKFGLKHAAPSQSRR